MSTQQTAKTRFVETAKGTKFAYRRLGTGSGTPLVLLIHFRGTQDKWDPLLINTLAASRPIITVDYAGVGLSTGEVATTVRQSADDIIEFLSLIGETEIDLLGFSLGGMVAQLVALNADPKTVKIRKLVLAGTNTSAGEGVLPRPNDDVGTIAGGPHVSIDAFKTLFFPKTRAGTFAVEQWWDRINERSPATCGEEIVTTFLSDGFLDQGKGLLAQVSQTTAFSAVETSQGADGAYDRLPDLNIPVLVANGKNDYMIATANSFLMQQRLPNAQLIVYPDSGHGFLFQYATLFAKHALLFLEA
ncbi:alpha/beta-hydrolase [Thozetella sp. PMI_491]|nr:alpha/beta-hydrolase [Thozetella sp. PMI_491]